MTTLSDPSRVSRAGASGGARPDASPARASRWRIAICTIAALCGFAGNSLITRSALDAHAIDATSFMSVRLIAGAVTLAALAGADATMAGGSALSAIVLAVYALGFTFAYERITAGVGALLLFGAVQITMIGWGLWRGERPRAIDWLGVALAMGGLFYLTWPGVAGPNAVGPDLVGSLLMIAAGASWGIYSVRGRGATKPLAATAGNFARTVPIAIVAWLVTLDRAHLSARGLLMATVSGSITSGIAYSLWYAALPGLSTWTAAIVQLCVPIVTALAATWLLGESVSSRMLISGALIVSGVLLSTTPRSTGPRPATGVRYFDEVENRTTTPPT
jgi:drug/metabolite transporter (DMT)-like permease